MPRHESMVLRVVQHCTSVLPWESALTTVMSWRIFTFHTSVALALPPLVLDSLRLFHVVPTLIWMRVRPVAALNS